MPRNKSNVPQVNRDEMLEKLESDPDTLNDVEKRWLQDHDMLPDDFDPVPVTFHLADGSIVSNDPLHFAMEMANNPAGMQEAIESRAQELAEQMLAQMVAAGQSNAVVDAAGPYHGNALNEPPAAALRTTPDVGGDDEDDDDYEAMTVKKLRGIIYERNEERADEDKISMDGRKEDLIAALEADDAANSSDEDESTENAGDEPPTGGE